MDAHHIISSFLSNFEDFINTSILEELENITQTSLVHEIGDSSHPKIQFLNQGVNSKEIIFFFLLRTMRSVHEHCNKFVGNIPSTLIELYEQFSHIQINWILNPVTNALNAHIIHGDKRQLFVKSRGTYYTPNFMSNFMCSESIDLISQQKLDDITKIIQDIRKSVGDLSVRKLIHTVPIRVIDISMGIGNFLCNAIPYVVSYLRSCKIKIQKELISYIDEADAKMIYEFLPFCVNVSKKEENLRIGRFIVEKCIHGIEIDPKIHQMAQIIIGLSLQSLLGCQVYEFPNILCKNTILSSLKKPEFPSIEEKITECNGFNWYSQFTEVFDDVNNGFDIVIGNPPWEILKPNHREFFSNYSENFMKLHRSQQDAIQFQLLCNPAISKAYEAYKSHITKQIQIISTLDYSYQSSLIRGRLYRGDPQLFKFFLEIAFKITRNGGIVSLIVQHNFLGSKSCANLRFLYVYNGRFSGIWEFHNKLKKQSIFRDVDSNQRVVVFLFEKNVAKPSDVFYRKCNSIDELRFDFKLFEKTSPDVYYKLSNEELQIYGFPNASHRHVFEKMMSTNHNFDNFSWKNKEIELNYSQDLHVTRDREKYSKHPTLIAINGGRNFGPYYFQPIKQRYLIENAYSLLNIPDKSLICRNILPNSAKRIIFSLPPDHTIVDNSCTRIIGKNVMDNDIFFFLLAISNSLLVEFFLRTILTGINLNYYLLDRIPFPSKESLMNEENAKFVFKLIQTASLLPQISLETEKWADNFALIEAFVAVLFDLTKKELLIILNSFDFESLQKTKFCGYRPFLKLTKDSILNYYEKALSRLI